MKRQVKASVGRSAGYSVSESVGEAAAAATGSGVLDIYTGALQAYSTGRRLRDNYTGALFRVRRSSDNAEQDIGFVAGTGVVDTNALTTFVGAGDGFLVTWYSQSLTPIDATQTTAASQAAIVLAGVVQTLGTNSIPAPLWDGIDDEVAVASLTIASDELVLWWACRDTSHAAIGHLLKYGTAVISTGEFRIRSPGGAGADTVVFTCNSSADTTLTTAAAPLTYVGRARAKLGVIRNVRFNKGAEATATGVAGTNFGAAKTLRIGNEDGGSLPYSGAVGEVFIYPSLTPATTDGIDDSMMTFWGIS